MGDLKATAHDVLSRLETKELFRTDWDTVAFIIFLIFVGTVLLLLLLVLIHCCCCYCHSPVRPYTEQRKRHWSVDNPAMEP